MIKIITIVGARPQFIKAAIVSKAIAKHNADIELLPDNKASIKEVIIHTGQHYDRNMSDVFFQVMDIPQPNYNLNINALSHGAMTGQMIEKIENILIKENPDWVIVYGDTNTTLAGALAAKKLQLKVAHIEAGLRSFNLRMPEEINRILTDRVSDILFCPTETAVLNLKKEGYPNQLIKSRCQYISKIGDVMYDAAFYYGAQACSPKDVYLENNSYILATVHREENTVNKERLKCIFETFIDIAEKKSIILPLHPRTKKSLLSLGKGYDFFLSNFHKSNSKLPSLKIISPVDYLEMLYLIKNCSLVMTDSGGLQKEAYFFKKPCVILREDTEWAELLQTKTSILTGANKKTIKKESSNLLKETNLDFSKQVFGDGKAAEKIVREIIKY